MYCKIKFVTIFSLSLSLFLSLSLPPLFFSLFLYPLFSFDRNIEYIKLTSLPFFIRNIVHIKLSYHFLLNSFTWKFNNNWFFLFNLRTTRKFDSNPNHIASIIVTLHRSWFRKYIDHLNRIVVFWLSQNLLHEA